MISKPVRHFLAGLVLAALPMTSFAAVSVGVSITLAPPALPVYVQPPLPAPGYIWTPGYWAYGPVGYYWVPGTWVMAPSPGLLWTPGYWGWGGGVYVWHPGYWGPHVGFYGGINYGFGYTGVGFDGGYWRGGAFYYNRSAANFGGVHITNVYNKTIINNVTVNRVSYNGGAGGLTARATPRQLSAERERHVEFTAAQRDHERMAASNRDLRATVNGGKPRIAATERPAVFTGRGVVSARAAGGSMHVAEHGPAARGPAEARTDRTDRPPGAAGSATRGGAGGAGRGPEHTGESPHIAQPRTDRPPGQHAPGSAEPPRPGGGERPAPHFQNPHPQNAPQAAPRQQVEPRQQMTPRPENAPHAQPPRGGPGGGEPRGQPHGQSEPRGPGGPGGREHGEDHNRR